MQEFLAFLIIGLVTGSLYGLAGAGLVLTYKTSGIYNFAHGALAAVAAYTFYSLHVNHGVSWPIAAVISVLVVGVVLGLVMEFVTRRLTFAPVTVQVVATMGLVLIVEAWASLVYGGSPLIYQTFLPSKSYKLADAYVSQDQIIIFAICVVCVTALYFVLRVTRIGMAMRGVVDNPDLLSLTGTHPSTVRRWAWVAGTTFAAMTGVLIAPSTNLSADALILLVLQATGAGAVGAFSSLPITFMGGLGIGVAASLLTRYLPQQATYLQGVPAGLPFIVLFLALVLTPRARLAAREARDSLNARMASGSLSMSRPSLVALGVLLVVALFVPTFAGLRLTVYASGVIYLIVFLSLGLLAKTSGQISLSQLGVAAVGAAAFAHLSEHGVPWLLCLLGAGVIAVPVGAILAIPAMRLPGVFLALATFSFGALLEQMGYTSDLMFGSAVEGKRISRPSFATGDKSFYYVALAAAVLAVVALVLLERARLGRLLHAMSTSPRALSTSGASVNVIRVGVFCISAFFAGIGGALLSGLFGYASGTLFGSFSSLTFFVLLMITIGGMPWYAIMAAAGITLIPSFITVGGINDYLKLIFGLCALGTVLNLEGGIKVRRARPMTGEKTAAAPAPVAAPAEEPATVQTSVPASAPNPSRRTPADASLEVTDLSVRFGGIAAVRSLDLRAPASKITGLIGPNGAGKTTTFNACSGLTRAATGRVVVSGTDVTRRSPASRAQIGLGRTYQQMQLWSGMTVRENVAMGSEAAMAGRGLLTHLAARPRDIAARDKAAQESIELTGLTALADRQVGELSTGQRRLVELARCLAGPFDILLLDEPSSGLDPQETRAFGRVLESVVQDRGVGILLVEHDMSLVMSVCSYVYVLDFGELIFGGTPGEVGASQVVRDAYLGREASTEDTALVANESAL